MWRSAAAPDGTALYLKFCRGLSITLLVERSGISQTRPLRLNVEPDKRASTPSQHSCAASAGARACLNRSDAMRAPQQVPFEEDRLRPLVQDLAIDDVKRPVRKDLETAVFPAVPSPCRLDASRY